MNTEKEVCIYCGKEIDLDDSVHRDIIYRRRNQRTGKMEVVNDLMGPFHKEKRCGAYMQMAYEG